MKYSEIIPRSKSFIKEGQEERANIALRSPAVMFESSAFLPFSTSVLSANSDLSLITCKKESPFILGKILYNLALCKLF